MKSPVQSTAELAERLGLSRWTVSRALNGGSNVNAATAERVREEARLLGFAPSLLGRGLRSGRTQLIGILAPDIEDFYLTRKLSILRNLIEAAGLQALIQVASATPENERSAIETFTAIRCTGVVVIASRLQPDDAVWTGLKSAGINAIFIDPLFGKFDHMVTTDRSFAMKETVGHLAGLGHRYFATLGFHKDAHYAEPRLRGLASACRAHGLTLEGNFRMLATSQHLDDFVAGAILATQLLEATDPRPTAVIALNDRLALGAMGAFQQAGLDIPADLSVVGYDNADFSAHLTPSLTTVDPRADQLIEKAMTLLLAQPHAGTRCTVRPKLCVRHSTGPKPI